MWKVSQVFYLLISCSLTVILIPKLTRSQCSPINTDWLHYELSVQSRDFEGVSTTGACTNMGTLCFGPQLGVSAGRGRLGDGSRGPQTLNVSAVQAWDQDVSITIGSFSSETHIVGINLYFYNIPSQGIGLPYDISVRSDTDSANLQFTLEGNQDLSQDDNQLSHITLIPQSLFSTDVIITFAFSGPDRIKWLLVTEIEICTSSIAVTLPDPPPPINFTNDTVSSVSPSTINSSITLTCSVTEGRFDWSWTGPPEISLPSPIVLNVGRTSVLELSQLSAGHSGTYRCMATHTYGREPRASASLDISLSMLHGTIQEESSTVRVTSSDSTATLRCMLYGYLPSGEEPSIKWELDGAILSNNSMYTITTEDGEMLIQNGEPQPIPSLTSTLTVNLTLSPLTVSQPYICLSDQAAGFQIITIMQDTVAPPPDTTSSFSSTTAPSTPSSDDSLGLILGVVISAIVVLITIIIIVIIVICVVRRRTQRSMDYLSDYSTKDPLYQELSKPNPPPLPAQFPTLSVSDIGPYAVVDNGLDYRHVEHINMNGLQSSTTDLSNPMPLRLKTQPRFLQNNPLYASADNIDQVSEAPDIPRRRMFSSVSSMNDLSNSIHGSILNIYAKPYRAIPPIPDRPPTPVLLEGSVYSESLSPSMLTATRYSSPPGSTGEVFECPASSVYADPQPLLRSEGPIEVAPTQIREVRTLGTGQFGQVLLAETVGLSMKDVRLSDTDNDRNITILVAIKRLKPDADRAVKEAFEKEIKFMSRLNNKNVVRLLGICPYGSAFIIMEYMENGDLSQYLRKHSEDDILPPETLLYMATQTASGMKYLATLKFIHRDLATRNCLVGSNNEVKIADFGMSRSLYSSYYYRVRGRAMLPIRWMANECFYGRFSEKTDVWAFGVTMWEIFTFGVKQPYNEMNDQELIDDAIKGPERQLLKKPDCCPAEVYEVMLRCWVDDPEGRANFAELHSMLEAIYEHNNPSLT